MNVDFILLQDYDKSEGLRGYGLYDASIGNKKTVVEPHTASFLSTLKIVLSCYLLMLCAINGTQLHKSKCPDFKTGSKMF